MQWFFFFLLTNSYRKKKIFFNEIGQIIRIIPDQRDKTKRKNRSPSDILREIGPLSRLRTIPESRLRPNLRFRFTGATRKMKRRGEGGRRGEGIDYWSLCQANAISRIEDSIQGDVNIVPRMNDEFFASLPPPPRFEYLSTEQYGVLSFFFNVCERMERKKKKKDINSRGGRGIKIFISISKRDISI